jgi:hypothetical protein
MRKRKDRIGACLFFLLLGLLELGLLLLQLQLVQRRDKVRALQR